MGSFVTAKCAFNALFPLLAAKYAEYAVVELFVDKADTTEAPLPVIDPVATLVARLENDPGGYCPCKAMWRLPGIPRGDIVVVAGGGGGGGGEDTGDPAEFDVVVVVAVATNGC